MRAKVTRNALRKRAVLLGMDYSYSPSWAEHRVNLKLSDGGTADTAYYTNDAQDAWDTLHGMARERDRMRLRTTTAYTEVLTQVFNG
jgi:hypothetical protein